MVVYQKFMNRKANGHLLFYINRFMDSKYVYFLSKTIKYYTLLNTLYAMIKATDKCLTNNKKITKKLNYYYFVIFNSLLKTNY